MAGGLRSTKIKGINMTAGNNRSLLLIKQVLDY